MCCWVSAPPPVCWVPLMVSIRPQAGELPSSPEHPGAGSSSSFPQGGWSHLCLSHQHRLLPTSPPTGLEGSGLRYTRAWTPSGTVILKVRARSPECIHSRAQGSLGEAAWAERLVPAAWRKPHRDRERGWWREGAGRRREGCLRGDSSSDSRSNNLTFPRQICSGGGD